jgi:YVTN family beta-propeller protein
VAAGVEFRILGPLEVVAAGTPVQIGGPRQRALLAFLLLSANRVVSRDRLVDELALGQRALTVQVSRLRKTLAPLEADGPRLLARPPGYLLRVEPDELDLDAFDRLLREGRRAHEDGDPERAVKLLREAESLWRGRTLADLEFEPFARLEIDRLEEQRLAAVEERIEAELELGRHPALVSELEALAAEHPLRERLQAQLMLALYRCGRQAEALAGYRVLRSRLADELGLEPSPALKEVERAILQQDERLAAPPATPRPAPARSAAVRAPRRRGLPVAALATLAAAAALAGVLVPKALRPAVGSRALVDGSSLVLLDANGRPRDSVRLDAGPTEVAAGFGALRVTSSDGNSLIRIDAERHQVRQTIAVGGGASGVAVGAGAVWVANSLDGTVSRVDPDTNRAVQTIAVGPRPTAVAFARRSIWVANAGGHSLSRIDPASGRVVDTVPLEDAPTALAAGGGSLWAASGPGRTVTEVDPATGDVRRTIGVGSGPSGIAYSAGAVWVANCLDGTLSKIDARRGVVLATIPVGNGPAQVAAGPHAVWVAEDFGGRLAQIDPRAPSVVRRLPVGSRPSGIALASGGAWVGVRAQGPSHRGGTLTLLRSAPRFESLDPAGPIALQPTTLLGMTNDGLVTFEHVGGSDGAELVPDLATGLPAPTDGGRTYSFSLRRGIRYSTGGPVRANDVRSSLERLFRVGSPGTSFYGGILGSEGCSRRRCDLRRGIATDDRTGAVTFHLAAPDPDFLYKLALPFAYVLPAGSPLHDIGTRPLPATGPYVIRVYRPGRELRLARNPRFHEWSQAAQPNGYPNAIVWKLGVPPGRALADVERGSADWLLDYGALPATGRR